MSKPSRQFLTLGVKAKSLTNPFTQSNPILGEGSTWLRGESTYLGRRLIDRNGQIANWFVDTPKPFTAAKARPALVTAARKKNGDMDPQQWAAYLFSELRFPEWVFTEELLTEMVSILKQVKSQSWRHEDMLVAFVNRVRAAHSPMSPDTLANSPAVYFETSNTLIAVELTKMTWSYIRGDLEELWFQRRLRGEMDYDVPDIFEEFRELVDSVCFKDDDIQREDELTFHATLATLSRALVDRSIRIFDQWAIPKGRGLYVFGSPSKVFMPVCAHLAGTPSPSLFVEEGGKYSVDDDSADPPDFDEYDPWDGDPAHLGFLESWDRFGLDNWTPWLGRPYSIVTGAYAGHGDALGLNQSKMSTAQTKQFMLDSLAYARRDQSWTMVNPPRSAKEWLTLVKRHGCDPQAILWDTRYIYRTFAMIPKDGVLTDHWTTKLLQSMMEANPALAITGWIPKGKCLSPYTESWIMSAIAEAPSAYLREPTDQEAYELNKLYDTTIFESPVTEVTPQPPKAVADFIERPSEDDPDSRYRYPPSGRTR
jgi:hypothetical protein